METVMVTIHGERQTWRVVWLAKREKPGEEGQAPTNGNGYEHKSTAHCNGGHEKCNDGKRQQV